MLAGGIPGRTQTMSLAMLVCVIKSVTTDYLQNLIRDLALLSIG